VINKAVLKLFCTISSGARLSGILPKNTAKSLSPITPRNWLNNAPEQAYRSKGVDLHESKTICEAYVRKMQNN